MLTKNKPNILYVFGGEKAQGAEIVIERLMAHNADEVNAHLVMAPGKFASSLVSANKPYQITLLDDLKKLNRSSTGKFKFYTRALTNYFKVSYKIHQYIKKHHIDVVHANTMVPAAYLLPLVSYSRLFNKRLKWCWSDHDLKYFSKLDTLHSQSCAKLYDYTIVVSEAVKRKYNGNSKAIVLYNGLDLNIFKPDAASRNAFRSKQHLSDDTIVIGIAAVISPDKGQLSLIQVFNKLSEKFPHIKLILAGGFAADTPAYSQEVQAAANSSANVIYLGYADNMSEFYNGCDIIISNSNAYRSESLGTTIYEAMAFEKVVVASDTGGTPEIITDNKDGFLFETGSTSGLYEKLDYAISNYNSLSNIRTAARNKANQKFNITTMTKRYNEIIHSLFATA